MALTIDSTSIAEPQKFEIERYALTKAGRVASGKMTLELVAWKRKFNLTYEVITGANLDTILDLLVTTTMFHTLAYPEADGTTSSATVYVGAIKGEFWRNAGSNRIFRDVTFSLIEQ